MVDRRARAEETRRQLLDAATRVFETSGYRATSVAAITKEAATAHGTFYLYFRNKEDVFGEVVQGLIVELYEHSFTSLGPPDGRLVVDRLEQRIAAFIETFAARPGIWRALLEASLQSPEVAARWGEARAGLLRRIVEGWRQLVDAGVMADDDFEVMADALGGMLEWTALRSVVFGAAGASVTDEHGNARPELVATLTSLWIRAVTG